MWPMMTKHGEERLKQRGSQVHDVEIVFRYGDVEVPAHRGCRFLRLSHHTANSLLVAGILPVQAVDRARRLVLLLDPSDRLVTVVKCNPYRRIHKVKR